MEQPEGFEIGDPNQMKCLLKRTLYGLKQSPREWNMVINDYLLNEGFVQSKADNCIYVKTEDDLLFVGVYVDDIISVGKLPAVNLFRKKLRDHFKITDGGPLEWYLGVAFVQNDDFTISLNQNQYVAQKLEEFAPYCEKGGVSTPLPLDYQRILEEAEKEETTDTDFPYRQIVGSLMYAMLATRPDICVAVSVLSRYLDNPEISAYFFGKTSSSLLERKLNLLLNLQI